LLVKLIVSSDNSQARLCRDTEPSLAPSLDPRLASQPRYPVPPTVNPLGFEFSSGLLRSMGLFTLLMHFVNLSEHRSVRFVPLGFLALAPTVIPTPAIPKTSHNRDTLN